MYTYKLAGRRCYMEFNIDNKQEIVFDLEQWYMHDDKPIDYILTINKLIRQFKDEPVRFIRFPHTYYCVFRVNNDNFTHIREDQLGTDLYPIIDSRLIKWDGYV